MIRKIYNYIKRQQNAYKDLKRLKKIDLNEKYIILISHNADGSGGAPVVLYEYAKYLAENGKKILFLTYKGGNLVNKKDEKNIDFFLMESYQTKYIDFIKKINIEYIIVNTIVCYKSIKLLQEINEKRKVLWWIHEEKRIIEKYKNKIPQKIMHNIHVMCVSQRIKNDMQEVRNDIKYGLMYYGCKDNYSINFKKDIINGSIKNEKYVIAIIGRICARKNQLQIIEAYNKLNNAIREKIEIIFVAGSYEESYKKMLITQINKNQNIKIIGPIQRNKMDEIYMKSNLIICPSVDDPLPVVITEAMMYKKLFITSSATGQAQIITNGIDGIIYDVHSVDDLAKQITKCFLGQYDERIKDNARKLYEDYFSLEHLEKQITSL